MTPTGMAHEMAREELEAFVLDALDANERASVLAHVARCVACQMEVAALQSAATELAFAVKPVSLPDAQRDRVRSRLLARASADVMQEAPAPPPKLTVLVPPPRPTPSSAATVVDSADFHPSPQFHIMVPHNAAAEAAMHPQRLKGLNTGLGWMAVAASFVAVVSLAMLVQTIRDRDNIQAAFVAVTAQRGGNSEVLDSLRASVADRDRMIANLTGPSVAVVTLAANGVRAPSARMFWDQSVNAWTFVAHNLPRPKPGRVYQLWLVTANQKISAGVFIPQANGEALVRATYALPANTLAAVAVTDEPETGSAQPTTVPLIVGSAR